MIVQGVLATAAIVYVLPRHVTWALLSASACLAAICLSCPRSDISSLAVAAACASASIGLQIVLTALYRPEDAFDELPWSQTRHRLCMRCPFSGGSPSC